jgi:hypothetical protein
MDEQSVVMPVSCETIVALPLTGHAVVVYIFMPIIIFFVKSTGTGVGVGVSGKAKWPPP